MYFQIQYCENRAIHCQDRVLEIDNNITAAIAFSRVVL